MKESLSAHHQTTGKSATYKSLVFWGRKPQWFHRETKFLYMYIISGYQKALSEEHHATMVGVSDLASLYHAHDEFQWPLRLRDRALESCVRVLDPYRRDRNSSR